MIVPAFTLKNCLTTALAGALFFVLSCAVPPERDIRIMGSTTMAPLLERLAEAWGPNHTSRIHIEAVGSVAGISALIARQCDLASSSSVIASAVLTDAEKLGIHLKAFPVCRDRIIPVVHTANPIGRIRLNDLREIFLGHITGWKPLTGLDEDIRLILRPDDSGTHQTWQQVVLDGAPPGKTGHRVSSNSAVLAAVAENTGAIGYISEAFLNPEVKKIDILQGDEMIHIDRPLLLYADTGRLDSRLKAFLAFLYSEPAQRIMADFGFTAAEGGLYRSE